MGGAFVAVADDASAGFWNSAGLAFAPDRLTQLDLKFNYITALSAAANHHEFGPPLPDERDIRRQR